jgi:hypothetical protein
MKGITSVMERLKNLQEYEVQVNVPDDFQFRGRSPYDIYIANNIAFVKVVAASLDEAVQKANEFFNEDNVD